MQYAIDRFLAVCNRGLNITKKCNHNDIKYCLSFFYVQEVLVRSVARFVLLKLSCSRTNGFKILRFEALRLDTCMFNTTMFINLSLILKLYFNFNLKCLILLQCFVMVNVSYTKISA